MKLEPHIVVYAAWVWEISQHTPTDIWNIPAYIGDLFLLYGIISSQKIFKTYPIDDILRDSRPIASYNVGPQNVMFVGFF